MNGRSHLLKLFPLPSFICAALLLWASLAYAQTPKAEKLPTGVVVPRVACGSDPGQSYALYLPSGYTEQKKWPIVYAFDPGAQGQNPVEQMKALAEGYGYILAGSNNSRNGPWKPQGEAAQAMLDDASSRLSIDTRRVYFTGFSGGARVAGRVGVLCQGCAAAVIAHGAGLNLDEGPNYISFPLFLTIGDTDFNNEEVARLTQQLEESGKPNRLRSFPGPHQWPPAEVWAEAFEWIELMAMKEERRPKDDLSVAAALARATERAAALERTDPLAAYEDYRRLAREFDGLAHSAAFANKAAELKDSKAVRDGRARQEGEFRRTKELWEELGRTVLAVRAHAEDRPRILLELRNRAEDLYRQAEGTRDPRRAIVIRRALASAFAFAIEEGFEQLRQKSYAMAAVNFEAAGEINPRIPWPFFSLARAQALMGDRKRCFRALGKAVDNGMMNAAILREAPEFAAWRDDPDFRKLVKRVEANAQ